MRELGSGTMYNTHNTTSLIRTLKYVSDILQTEEAFTVKGYKHTHAQQNLVSKKIIYKVVMSPVFIVTNTNKGNTGFMKVLTGNR